MLNNRHATLLIVTVAQLSWLSCVLAEDAAWVRIVPEKTDEILANPGMGWETFHRTADNDNSLSSFD